MPNYDEATKKVVQAGIEVIDSREVAEMIQKDHSEVVERIRKYGSVIKPDSIIKFFLLSTYKDEQNKIQAYYLLTESGCDVVGRLMDINRQEEKVYKEKYTERFNEMKRHKRMPWKKKEWNDKLLGSEDFVGALEGEFEDFMERGEVTPNQLKERCLELATALANWADELHESIEQKGEEIEKLKSEIK